MFPITLDPFSGYSDGKDEDAIGNSQGCQNLIDEENNLNKTVEKKIFNHPLGKNFKRMTHFFI